MFANTPVGQPHDEGIDWCNHRVLRTGLRKLRLNAAGSQSGLSTPFHYSMVVAPVGDLADAEALEDPDDRSQRGEDAGVAHPRSRSQLRTRSVKSWP